MPTTRRSAEKTLKILVADDTRANREILRVFLEKGGHTVILAGDGREAVERQVKAEVGRAIHEAEAKPKRTQIQEKQPIHEAQLRRAARIV